MYTLYKNFPFFESKQCMDNLHKTSRFNQMKKSFTQNQIDLLEQFHTGSYRISGTTYLFPEFIVSKEARKTLNYPQGFCIMEADSSYYTNRSGLESYELRFVLDGNGILEYEGQTYHLQKDSGFLIDCHKPHLYYTVGNRWTCTIFHLYGPTVAYVYQKIRDAGDVHFTADSCPGFEMLQCQVLKASLDTLPYLEAKISCLIDILLTEILAGKNSPLHTENKTDLIADIINYLQNHFSENISLTSLNHSFGISRTDLCKEFKKYTGFTVKQYLLELRFNHAKRLLQHSSFSIESVAEQSGFHDTAYFIQMFKKAVGMTPLQYRKKQV